MEAKKFKMEEPVHISFTRPDRSITLVNGPVISSLSQLVKAMVNHQLVEYRAWNDRPKLGYVEGVTREDGSGKSYNFLFRELDKTSFSWEYAGRLDIVGW